MLSSAQSLQCIVALCLVLVTLSSAQLKPRRGKSSDHLLGHLKRRTDFQLGVALKSEQLADIGPGKHSCVLPNINMAVPEYEMKWDPVEPSSGVWNWKGSDAIASYLQGHKRGLRGHAGLWDQALPGWVNGLVRGGVADALHQHVFEVVRRYGKDMISFDVVNEPFDYDQSGNYKQSVFYRNLGHQMFSIAFKAADDARTQIGSKVKLYLNENNVEADDAGNVRKRTALLNLVDTLLKEGVKLEGIGLQGHFDSDVFPADFGKVIKEFTDRGLEVMITELDIRIKNSGGEEALIKQAQQYAAVYDACLANKMCKGVVRWNFDDSHSWIPSTYADQGRATMFGPNCTPKPLIMKEVIKVLQKY